MKRYFLRMLFNYRLIWPGAAYGIIETSNYIEIEYEGLYRGTHFAEEFCHFRPGHCPRIFCLIISTHVCQSEFYNSTRANEPWTITLH